MGKNQGGEGDGDIDRHEPTPLFSHDADDGSQASLKAQQSAASQDDGAGGDDDWEPPSKQEWQAHQDRLAAAEEAVKGTREQLEQNTMLMRDLLGRQAPAAAAQDAGPQKPGPPPDSVREPEKFAEWLALRDQYTEGQLNRKFERLQSDFQTTLRANDLFTRFVARYPGMADKRDLVELAAKRAGLRSNDSDDRIFKKTIESLATLGFSIDPAHPSQTAQAGLGGRGDGDGSRGGDDGRAVGLGDGSAQRRSRRAPKPEKVVDLVDQLSEDQVRLGVM